MSFLHYFGGSQFQAASSSFLYCYIFACCDLPIKSLMFYVFERFVVSVNQISDCFFFLFAEKVTNSFKQLTTNEK